MRSEAMTDLKTHFEPYLQLAEVTDRAALIAWGGFFFWISGEHPTAGQDWMLIDDDGMHGRFRKPLQQLLAWADIHGKLDRRMGIAKGCQ
jgi:hypothetical protein